MLLKGSFDQHSSWQREFASWLTLLAEWMRGHDLLDTAVKDRLRGLGAQAWSDKVMVAFVAGFSRAKSELINAFFFAGYGWRSMPACVGLTSMYPTKLASDAELPSCRPWLPTETRLQTRALMDWRAAPGKCTSIELDADKPEQLAQAFDKVDEIRPVRKDEAGAFGFWHDENTEEHPPEGPDGMLEVPKWRHALIDIAQPLLQRGLVILDAPGLNAIGAEAEFRLSVTPSAHAVVFIFAVAAGVMKSDLAIWREHLVAAGQAEIARLAVLNKIDTLRDSLSSAQQIKVQVERHRTGPVGILGWLSNRPLQCQHKKRWLPRSIATGLNLRPVACPILSLPRLWSMSTILTARRQLSWPVEAGRSIHVHRRDRVEQTEKIPSLKVKTELIGLVAAALKRPGINVGVKKADGRTFPRLRGAIRKAKNPRAEIYIQRAASFNRLNVEFGLSRQTPEEPKLVHSENDLAKIEKSHLLYGYMANLNKLSQFDSLVCSEHALSPRLGVGYKSALSEVELRNKSASAQADRERCEWRRSFGRRIEAIERI